MVVGWSDFAIGLAPATERRRKPDGVAAGQCATHPQQTKHFQRGSATVLCTTVNFAAYFLLRSILIVQREIDTCRPRETIAVSKCCAASPGPTSGMRAPMRRLASLK